MLNPLNLLSMISDKAKNYADNNADNIGIILAKSIIKGTNLAIKSIDKFLESKGIDVKDIYEKAKSKGESLLDKAKSAYEKTKEVGLKNMIPSIIDSGKERISKMLGFTTGPPGSPIQQAFNTFKGYFGEIGELAKTKSSIATLEQDSNGNPVVKLVENESGTVSYLSIEKYKRLKQILMLSSDQEIQENFDTSILEKTTSKESLLDKIKGLFSKKDTDDNQDETDKDAVGEKKKSWFQKLKDRVGKRKQEVEDEKKAVSESKRKDKKESWLGKLLAGIMSVGGLIAAKIVSAVKFLGGFMLTGVLKGIKWIIPAIGNAILKLIPGIGTLAGGIARATSAIVGGAVGTTLKAAGGIALKGVAAIASSPIGWAAAAIGAAAYGGYKLYKYFTNGNFANNVYGKLSELRMATYGFNQYTKSYYSKLLDLDMLAEPYIVFNNGRATMQKFSQEDRVKVLEIFGIDANNKEQFNLISEWFIKRYVPAFTSFMTALKLANNAATLETLDTLSSTELQTFINTYNIPNSIFTITNIPVTTNAPSTTKEEVDLLYNKIRSVIENQAPAEPKSILDRARSTITGVGTSISGVYNRFKETGGMRGIRDRIGSKITNTLGSIVDNKYISTLRNSEFMASISNKALNIRQGLSESKDKVTQYITDQLSTIKDNVLRVTTAAKDMVLGTMLKHFDSIKEKTQEVIGKMADSVNKLFEPIAGAITKIKDVFGGISESVSNKITSVKDTATNLFNRAISGASALLEKTGINKVIQFGIDSYKQVKRLFSVNKIAYSTKMLLYHLYGFGRSHVFYHSKLASLDYLLRDLIEFSNGKATITKLDSSTTSKILDLFNVPDRRTSLERYTIFDNWFKDRYLPVYLTFVSAIKNIDSKYTIFDISNLKNEELLELLTRLVIPSSIYSIKVIPVLDNNTVVPTKDEIDLLLNNTITELRNRIKPTNELEQPETKPTVNIKETPVAAPRRAQPNPVTSAPVTNRRDSRAVPLDQEGEVETRTPPNATPVDREGTLNNRIQGRLNVAQGELTRGSNDLSGISTRLDVSKIHNLDPNVKELFLGMSKEYHFLTGKKLGVNEAFRSYEDQMALKRRFPTRAATPGNSTHEFGLAIDVNSSDVRALNELGLLRKYGFTTSVGGEPWHIEPIGVSVNPSLSRTDPVFRQNAVLSSPGKGGGGFGLVDGSPLGRRNIPLQKAIFNASGGNIVTTSASPVEKTVASNIARSGPGYASNIARMTSSPISMDGETKPSETPSTTTTRISRQPTQPAIDSTRSSSAEVPSTPREVSKQQTPTMSRTSTQTPTKTPEPQPLPQKEVFISNSKIECILSNQLNTLIEMSVTLKSIDDKFNIDKLKQPTPQPSTKKEEPFVPPNTVDISRKSITI